SDNWSPFAGTATYSYSGDGVNSGRLTGVSGYAIAPRAVQGLLNGSNAAVSAIYDNARITDPNNHKTTYTLDNYDLRTGMATADGALATFQRDNHEQVLTAVDQLGRTTNYAYVYGTGAGDLTEIDYPDGALYTYAYEQNFHHVTSATDPLKHITTYT